MNAKINAPVASKPTSSTGSRAMRRNSRTRRTSELEGEEMGRANGSEVSIKERDLTGFQNLSGLYLFIAAAARFRW